VSNRTSLVAFVVAVLGGGLIIGYLNTPGDWYEQLDKPLFTPPGWLFGPVWSLLYVLIAIAGWRIWQREGFGLLFALWALQLALNFLWSPVFFSGHQVGFALVIVLALLATVCAFIVVAWSHDRVAAWLFVPYAGWVAFAGYLNAAIFVGN
jgi:translocator protein